MDQVLNSLRTFGVGRFAAMGAVAFGLVGIFAFLMMRFGQPDMVPMFADLSYSDSAAIVSELDSRGVPYELRQNGGAILVPEDQVLRLRLSLAEEGVPAGGVVGYEIFDKTSTLGTTSFIQNVNRTRALEGELARTIRAIDRVQMARVHLVQPERELFARDRTEPSASIVLRVRGDLEPIQIRSIQNLVASAVENLKPQRVSIVDETGRLLASGRDSDDAGFLAVSLEERAIEYERRLSDQITNIVSEIVGPNRARVEVAAELDYNRITQTSDTYDPDGRVVRSTQTREDSSNASEPGGNQGVSVANELPNADGTGGEEPGNQESTSSTEEIINYEISRTSRTEVLEAGRIKRLSVAVLIDGIYTRTPDGQFTYEPRSQEQIDQIAALVRSAMGFDQDRGDTVEVANIQFAEPIAPAPLVEDDTFFLGFTRTDVMKMAELGTLLLIAVIVLLVVVRPLVRRIIDPTISTHAASLPPTAIGSEAQALAVDANGNPGLLAADETDEQKNSPTLDMIEVAKMAGEVQASTVKRVGELVENNPDEATTIVRQWISERAA